MTDIESYQLHMLSIMRSAVEADNNKDYHKVQLYLDQATHLLSKCKYAMFCKYQVSGTVNETKLLQTT